MITEAAATVLAALRESASDRSVRELGNELGLHPTTVRFHLARLMSCGLVAEVPPAPGGRGRPAVHYRALGEVPRSTPWQAMAEALVVVAGAGPKARDRARRAGRHWADRAWASERVSVLELSARLGFAPHRTSWGAELRACPFAVQPGSDEEVICSVHAGLASRLGELQEVPQRVRLIPFAGGELGPCALCCDPSGHETATTSDE